MLPFVFAFLCVKVNSKETSEEISLPFSEKSRFKANYLRKNVWLP